jgi:hypothetical protein
MISKPSLKCQWWEWFIIIPPPGYCMQALINILAATISARHPQKHQSEKHRYNK